jgi:hypothetical protein
MQAPDKPGSTAYVCSIHALMMKGVIEVAPSTPTRRYSGAD